MTIKSDYDTNDQIPPEYAALYVERNGRWEIDIEGVKPQAAFDAAKRALDAERERARQIEAQWKGWVPLAKHDPAHIQSIIDRLPEYEALQRQGIDANTRAEELANARIQSATLPIERQRDALAEQLSAANARLEQLADAERRRTIDDAIRAAATKAGVDQDSMEDAILYGRSVLEVAADGVVQVRDGSPGLTAGLDAERMMLTVRDNGMRPRWWADNVSGGLRGSKPGAAPSGVNPYDAATLNITEQARIERENPALAERMRRSAKA